jgi:biofilm PGA synthesis N-glycosyltransferase PgaC
MHGSGPDTVTQLSALDVLAELGTTNAPRQVTVLIPAHNEESSIGHTLISLRQQSLPPREVVVVCDNCTDDTANVASKHGAWTYPTRGNTAKKAGALNQALSRLLRGLGSDDFVLVMDADSQLNKGWIAEAASILSSNRKVGAVCGVYIGEDGSGLLGQLQRNEYVRYARAVFRRRQAPVLSGTGTMFRVSALREIARERGRRLHGAPGEYYNTRGITEDNEITLALKTLGLRCIPAAGCLTVTEVMPTLRHLYHQRLRWQTGTLIDLMSYGLTKVTLEYWIRQIGMYLGICLTIACWVIIAWSMAADPDIDVPWTLAVVGIGQIERIWTVRRGGFRAVALTAVILPEFGYDIFRMVVFIRSLAAAIARRDVGWNHVKK